MSKEYITEKRKAVFAYLQGHAEETVSVPDIMLFLEREQISANVTTIYRYLDRLYEQGIVRRIVAEKGSMTRYQYVGEHPSCHEHLHVQCVKCGKVSHLECHFMQEVMQHIDAEHGFRLMCGDSILYGVCQECQQKEKEKTQ
ncbi:MAG: Fur family transcriptional regulator [Lachnospiraceae bacterium]